MKILLLGAAGQVGWELRRSLAVLGEVVALDRSQADLSQPDTLAPLVRTHRPQAIVNAAAYTAVDKAESDTELAFTVNARACEVLARAAAEHDAWLVHYSTDYVFDGTGERAWTESDPTAPLNAYGRSKRAGEEAIEALCPQNIILRTSWVYGRWGGNFLKTILRAAAQRAALDVVDDQVGAPTGAPLIADITAHILRRARPVDAGIYHLAATGHTSWNGYAREAIAQALACGAVLKATPDAVRTVPSSHFQTAARRPTNSRLDTRRLRETFELHLPAWQDGVGQVVRELAAHGVVGIQPGSA